MNPYPLIPNTLRSAESYARKGLSTNLKKKFYVVGEKTEDIQMQNNIIEKSVSSNANSKREITAKLGQAKQVTHTFIIIQFYDQKINKSQNIQLYI